MGRVRLVAMLVSQQSSVAAFHRVRKVKIRLFSKARHRDPAEG